MATKADLVKNVQKHIGLAKTDASLLVDSVIESIRQMLEQGENVKLSGFGNFNVNQKRERLGRNPKTGEEVMISARSVVTFHPSNKMREKINKS